MVTKEPEKPGQLYRHEVPFPEEDIEDESEFGICDGCSEYSEGLLLSEGEWLCRNCERLM